MKFDDFKYINYHHNIETPFNFFKYIMPQFKNKTILIISPFIEQIEKQTDNIKKLYIGLDVSNYKFKFLKVHITYYDSKKNEYLNTPHNNFLETVEHYNNLIKNIDFDVALLSCGTYAHFLGEYIKNIGKKSIYIGGVLPLYFGIFGDRYIYHYFHYFNYNYCVLNGYSIDHGHKKESLNYYLYDEKKYDIKNITHEKYSKLFDILNVNNHQSKILVYIFIEKNGGIPDDFNCDTYLKLNNDLKNLTKISLLMHYVFYGKKENRKYIE